MNGNFDLLNLLASYSSLKLCFKQYYYSVLLVQLFLTHNKHLSSLYFISVHSTTEKYL